MTGLPVIEDYQLAARTTRYLAHKAICAGDEMLAYLYVLSLFQWIDERHLDVGDPWNEEGAWATVEYYRRDLQRLGWL